MENVVKEIEVRLDPGDQAESIDTRLEKSEKRDNRRKAGLVVGWSWTSFHGFRCLARSPSRVAVLSKNVSGCSERLRIDWFRPVNLFARREGDHSLGGT